MKLNEIKTLLDNLPEQSSVAITAADTILQELFTHQGGGTLFVQGVQLNEYSSIGQCDLHALSTLLKGKGQFDLKHFENLQTCLAKIYTFGNPGTAYAGAAIVKFVEEKCVLEIFHVDESLAGMFFAPPFLVSIPKTSCLDRN